MWEETEAVEVPAASREHAPTLRDTSHSELLEELQHQFLGPDYAVALEVLEFLQEKGLLGGRGIAPQKDSAVLARCIKILRYIKTHPNSTAIYAALYVWDDPLLDDLNGHLTQTEFAQAIGVTKAAVNNAAKDAQRFFKLPPRQDQRKPEACETMRQTIIARLEQQPK